MARDITYGEFMGFSMKLVKQIETHPCLYNTNLQEYADQEIKDDAWQAIADELEEAVSTCKDKWRNLRTAYVRKVQSPPDKESKRAKPYYLQEAMQYLLPFLKLHRTADQHSEEKAENSLENENKQLEDNLLETNNSVSGDIDSGVKKWKARKKQKRSSANLDLSSLELVYKNQKEDDVDHRKLFLLSLLPDVHAMTDIQVRKFKKLVLEAVDTAME